MAQNTERPGDFYRSMVPTVLISAIISAAGLFGASELATKLGPDDVWPTEQYLGVGSGVVGVLSGLVAGFSAIGLVVKGSHDLMYLAGYYGVGGRKD